MAQVELKAFEEALRADEALQQKYQEALKHVAETADATSDGEAIQKAAASLGYELTLEELEQAWAAEQQLDDAELEMIAGGKSASEDDDDDFDHDWWCVAAWHCYTALLHTSSKYAGVSCWSNYQCIVWSK